MQVYSPSNTSTWLRCPILRQLGQEGWTTKYLQKKDIAAAIGTGFAAGIGAWNEMRKNFEAAQGVDLREIDATLQTLAQEEKGAAAMGVAKSVYEAHIQGYKDDGFDFSNVEEDYLDAAPTELSKAVARYCADDPIDQEWRIIAVEPVLAQHGNCRPDLVVRTPRGLAVVDYKTKVELKAQYRAKTIAEYRNSEQAFQYPWAVSEEFGEPCDEFTIALCVFRPRFSVELLPQVISPETLAVWLEGRKTVWNTMAAMDAGHMVPWMSDKHYDNFGQCPMYKACFDAKLDPDLMRAMGYVNVSEKTPEIPPT